MAMKRTVSIILAILMLVSISGCRNMASSKEKTGTKASSANLGYETKLFDTGYVHTVDISISEDDWSDLLANPLDKTKYDVNITIDDETVEHVSFATKGNTSLSSVAQDEDSDRYSFKVNFGKYTEGQTYYGLNKLNLNNIYADATYMKDYLSYEIFRQAGVDAPLTSYVWLTVNGEDFGLYLAIEDISESYLARTSDGEGELYKPETEQLANMDQEGGGKGFGDIQIPDDIAELSGDAFAGGMGQPGMQGDGFQKGGRRPDQQGNGSQGEMNPSAQSNEVSQDGVGMKGQFEGGFADGMEAGMQGEISGEGAGMGGLPGMDGKGFGQSANGADLSYSDDEISSYSDIFDNSVTDADDEDMQRVISALKALSKGEDLEDCLDTDEIIRYFAAHNFVLNYDSYTGNMLHNYYLYENDGKLAMLPWDYNLAFGGFSGGGKGGFENRDESGNADESENGSGNQTGSENENATALVNTGIATPLSQAEEDARPMWSWIASNEEYLQKYYDVYDELITNYFESGKFEEQVDALYKMLYPYVEKDPSAFYTADEFTKGYQTLKQFCILRSESIRKQLDGSLSVSTDEQVREDQVDASDINIKDMGSQGGHDGEDGFGGGKRMGQDMQPGQQFSTAVPGESASE